MHKIDINFKGGYYMSTSIKEKMVNEANITKDSQPNNEVIVEMAIGEFSASFIYLENDRATPITQSTTLSTALALDALCNHL